MRVLVMVKATKDSEAGKMPDTKLMAEMGRFNEELVKAGVMLAGEGCIPARGAYASASTAIRARSSMVRSRKPRSWSPASGSGR